MSTFPDTGVLLPPSGPGRLSWYALDHMVTVGETSRARFVYYSRLFDWQGVCRERFGFTHCPKYMKSLTEDHAMLTTSASCEFLGETFEGEHISLRLALPWVRLHFMQGDFAFYRIAEGGGEQLVARGVQTWANTIRSGPVDDPVFAPAPWSEEMLEVCARMGTDLSRALTA
ncbi:acyl-CoA thioesterase [Embleya sp. AB8]|uniref:acyl-CoA thioesterase n=1 Tax=Embleya sp. AB8 TaxID=3156304 RepID=UPI003C7826F0